MRKVGDDDWRSEVRRREEGEKGIAIFLNIEEMRKKRSAFEKLAGAAAALYVISPNRQHVPVAPSFRHR